jgi:hypothetical protein
MQTKCLGITRVEGAWEEHQVCDLVVDDPFPSLPFMGSSIVPLPLCTLGFVWQYSHDQGSKGPPSFVRYFHTCKSNPSYEERDIPIHVWVQVVIKNSVKLSHTSLPLSYEEYSQNWYQLPQTLHSSDVQHSLLQAREIHGMTPSQKSFSCKIWLMQYEAFSSNSVKDGRIITSSSDSDVCSFSQSWTMTWSVHD